MGTARISHLFVYVDDLDAALAFYRDVLGFDVFHRGEGSAFLRLPSDTTVLALQSRATAANDRDWMLVIDTEDIERRRTEITRTGTEISPVEPVPYGSAAQLRDPEGNLVELHQPNSS